MSACKCVFSNVFWEKLSHIFFQWECEEENCVYPENEGTEQQHQGGLCHRLPVTLFCGSIRDFSSFLKVKNLSQPYYTQMFQWFLPDYRETCYNLSQKRASKPGWMIPHYLPYLHKQTMSCVSFSCLGPTKLEVTDANQVIIACGYGQGHPWVNFSLHNSQPCPSIWVFFSEQKLFWRERTSRHLARLIKSNSAASVAAVRYHKRPRLV